MESGAEVECVGCGREFDGTPLQPEHRKDFICFDCLIKNDMPRLPHVRWREN